MKLFSCLTALALLVIIAGCGDSKSTSIPIEKSELEKYVEENPVPLVGADDFAAVNEEND